MIDKSFFDRDIKELADELYADELKEYSFEDPEVQLMVNRACDALNAVNTSMRNFGGIKIENLDIQKMSDPEYELKFTIDSILYFGLEVKKFAYLGEGLETLKNKINVNPTYPENSAYDNAREILTIKWFEYQMDNNLLKPYPGKTIPKFISKNKKKKRRTH